MFAYVIRDGSVASAVTITHVLVTNGTSLHVNMVAANGAYLQVGVTGTGHEPLAAGLSASESVQQLGGNLLDQEVIWRQTEGRSDGRTFGDGWICCGTAIPAAVCDARGGGSLLFPLHPPQMKLDGKAKYGCDGV